MFTGSGRLNPSLLGTETVTCFLTPGLLLPNLPVFPVTSRYIRPGMYAAETDHRCLKLSVLNEETSALPHSASAQTPSPWSQLLCIVYAALTIHTGRVRKLKAEDLHKVIDFNSDSVSLGAYSRGAGAHQARLPHLGSNPLFAGETPKIVCWLLSCAVS